ncbi:SAV_2336 N-terminal domain-related protein [Streptomyces sp. NPDC005012]|uniref:SAV_2336 N-terminal domain-related protein n=1 Tax=Streptomyces sp. NPDC005012 TaxID=3154558 RepID=UPI0033AC8FE0
MGGPRDPIAELVGALRESGMEPDAAQLVDALWLAGHLGPVPAPAADGERGGRDTAAGDGRPGTGATSGDGGTGPGTGTPPGGGPETDGADDTDEPASDPDPGRGGVPPDNYVITPAPPPEAGRDAGAAAGTPAIAVPAAPAFPSALRLQRALRPLQRYRTPGSRPRPVLDEAATAELSARAGGLLLPAFREDTRRDADLQIVVDASPSMRVWDRLAAELEQIFARIGAFRDVRTHHLHEGPGGRPRLSRSPNPGTGVPYFPQRLIDPTGRRVTCLVSDCAGPLWRGGQAHRLLHRLASAGPVVVVQPLPQRMWRRTALPATPGPLRCGPDGRVRLATPHPPPAPGAVPVPVLPPQPEALEAWARLLTSAGTGTVPGAAGWVRADQPPAPARPAARPPGPLERVSRFRASASPTASRLATHLAAAPLHLPVMQLVQRAMLPSSGPTELAEVLLGGLVAREPGPVPDDGPRFTMDPEVRQALLGPLGRDEALLVLKHCSAYVTRNLGRGGPNFPALAHAQLENADPGRTAVPPGVWEGAAHGADPATRPFAQVAAEVLRRFLPTLVPAPPDATLADVRRLVADFEVNGMVPSLLQAVRLLRQAAENHDADPALAAECATTLLRLWNVHGGAGLLDEALHHAETSVHRDPAGPGHAAVAAVLCAQADEAVRAEDRSAALALLARADEAYADACRTAPDADTLLRHTLDRARALETRWSVGGRSAPLQSGIGMLEALADSRTPGDLPPEVALVHGRLLRRLATTAADEAEARAHAARAARSLHTALTAHGDDADRALVLELADALLDAGPDAHADLRALLAEHLPGADGVHRARLLVRSGRLHLARHHETEDPAHLAAAETDLTGALDTLPRHEGEHAAAQVLLGGALLTPATPNAAPDPDRVGRAVSALRACLAGTAADDPAGPERRALLGRALLARYDLARDRVDLREAEHHLGLAARATTDPLTRAARLVELGRAQTAAATGLDRPARHDDAARTFRTAARTARQVIDTGEEVLTPRRAARTVTLAARALHLHAAAQEAAQRPRAAQAAYREAAEEWSRLPAGMQVLGEPTPEDTARRLEELTGTPGRPTTTGDP